VPIRLKPLTRAAIIALGALALVSLVLVTSRFMLAGAGRGGFGPAFAIVAGLTVVVSAGWMITVRSMRRTLASEGRKFATLVDAAPEVIIGVGDDGLIRFANAHVMELFGYSHAELVGAAVELLIPDRFREAHVASRGRYVERPRRRPMGSGMSLLARRRDGTELPVEISLSRIETRDGHVVLCIIRDVTEQTRNRRALVEANDRLKVSLAETGRRAEELRLLLRTGEFLQCCVSEREVHAVIARPIARIMPGAAGGLYLLNASRNLVELVTRWSDGAAALAETFEPQACWALRRGRVHVASAADAGTSCAHSCDEGDGRSLCVPMAAHGETIGVLCVRAARARKGRANKQLLRAVAEQGAIAIASLRLRDALRMQSTRDPLTGLYNRRFLDECLEREVSGSLRTQSTLSLLMLDLDHFKRFNDTFGHQCGDHALRDVAMALNRAVRRSDIVCRFGGEELVVLLPGTSTEQAESVAEKLREEVRQLVIRHNEQALGGLTVSIGIASSPHHARSPSELLRAADVALYASKHGGRDRVVVAAKLASDAEPECEADSAGGTALHRALPGASASA